MKRSMCGIALLAAATALWSCNGDPTGSIRDSGQKVLADPTSVFLDQGATKFVTVELVDGQGNQLVAEFTPQNVGAGITVERDTTFLETSTGHIQTSERFIITGVAPGSTSFDVVSGATSLTIPVRVVPTTFAATFSNAAPAVNEEVTITLPTGYKFAAGAGVSTDKGAGVVRSYSADSTAIVVLLPPASSGAVTLDSVQVDFLPGVTLAGIPTDATVTADGTPAAGTGSTATAPAMPVPGIGETTAFFDVGTFTAADITGDGGVGAQYYKFTVAAAGDYTITTDWPGSSDIDAIICFDAACSDGAFAGSGVSHPEEGTLTLTPGTYYFASVLFAGAPPANFFVQISAAATPPPAP